MLRRTDAEGIECTVAVATENIVKTAKVQEQMMMDAKNIISDSSSSQQLAYHSNKLWELWEYEGDIHLVKAE